MNETFVNQLIQSVGVPTTMLIGFTVAAWRYFQYQVKREEYREAKQQEHLGKQEAHINKLVNGEREILLTTIRETNEARLGVSHSLNRLSSVIEKMPCVMNPKSFEECQKKD